MRCAKMFSRSRQQSINLGLEKWNMCCDLFEEAMGRGADGIEVQKLQGIRCIGMLGNPVRFELWD